MMRTLSENTTPGFGTIAVLIDEMNGLPLDDVGRSFAGTVLTMGEYERIEDRYISTAMHFVREVGLSELVSVEVEQSARAGPPSEGISISLATMPSVMRSILRDQVWCKLECRPLFYLHFGYDYYMYIGYQYDLPKSIRFAIENGLFVEEVFSPYLRWE